MPRAPRVAPGGYVYHVVSRARGKLRLFRKEADFLTFYDVLVQAHCAASHPNPGLVRHAQPLALCRLASPGWRAFAVLRLPRPHPRRALADRTPGRRHGSRLPKSIQELHDPEKLRTWIWLFATSKAIHCEPNSSNAPSSGNGAACAQPARPRSDPRFAERLARPQAAQLAQRVNRPLTREELEAVRIAAERGRPLGSDAWVRATVERFDLQSTVRPRGRQPGWRKKKAK